MQNKIEAEKYFDEIKIKQNEKLQELVGLLKFYVSKYSLIPVLSKSFINDNLIFYKSNSTVNDDFLLSNYIADLYLSFQKNKKLEIPDVNITNEIFNCCTEIYQTCLTLDMLGNEINEEIKDAVVMLKYTERSIYLSILTKIFLDIIDEEYLSFFYKKTGFHLEYIVVFRNMLLCLIQDRIKNGTEENECILEFSEKDILNYVNNFYQNDEFVDITEIKKLIEYFILNSSDNDNYLPRKNIDIEKKTIFSSNDKFICFNPLSLVKNLFGILEDEVKKDSILWDKYSISKGLNLEKSAISILQKLSSQALIHIVFPKGISLIM